MGLHKKSRRNKKNCPIGLRKGRSKNESVLLIVKTDATFKLVKEDTVSYYVGKCIHCNTKLTVHQDGLTNATIEHIIPRGHGGTDHIQNIALACARCNSEKGIHHDQDYDSSSRAHEVVKFLQERRAYRWRDANAVIPSDCKKSHLK